MGESGIPAFGISIRLQRKPDQGSWFDIGMFARPTASIMPDPTNTLQVNGTHCPGQSGELADDNLSGC